MSSNTRGNVVLEIISSEETYSRLLDDFLTVYKTNLYSSNLLACERFASSLAGLVSNFEQISHVSKQLLHELNAAIAIATSLHNDLVEGDAVKVAAKARYVFYLLLKFFHELMQYFLHS